MDSSSKNIKINSSSIVSLKAELLRKEQEYQAERLQTNSTRPRHTKTKVKGDGLGTENYGVSARAAKDLEEQLIEDNVAKNARDILEKKAKVYDAMAKGYLKDDDENEDCLVDFHQKQVYRNREPVANQREPSHRGGEPELHIGDTSKSSFSDKKTESLPAGTIHYANVQHNEIRTHGVGYYQFSEDNSKRQEQIDLLNKLRSQTEEQKAKKERLKEKKQNLMAQRLAKMRQRRGLPEPPPEEEKIEKTPEVVPLVRDDTWRQVAPITREWDKGKKTDINKIYIERRRDERLQEFAPPVQFQLDSSISASQTQHQQAPYTNTVTKELHVPEANVNTSDIEKNLKSIRSETERHVSHRSGASPGASNFSGVQRENPPPGSPAAASVGDIPLPPTLKPNSLTIGTHQPPTAATPALTAHQVSTHPAPPPAPLNIPLPGADLAENNDPTPVPPGFPQTDDHFSHVDGVPPFDSTGSYQMASRPQEIPHWQHVDISKPPPSLVCEPQLPHSIPPLPASVASTDQTSYTVEADTSAVAPTLLGAPAEAAVAATMENPRKRHLAPQPAHYSSAPSKVHIPRPAYERVHLHQLPLTLPAPPTENNVPKYKAQDAAHIPKVWDKQNKQNKNIMHMWNSQYSYKGPK